MNSHQSERRSLSLSSVAMRAQAIHKAAGMKADLVGEIEEIKKFTRVLYDAVHRLNVPNEANDTPREGKPNGRWMHYKEAGQFLGGISGEAVRMMVRRGKLPYHTVGKRIYLDRLDLERMLEASKAYATAGAS